MYDQIGAAHADMCFSNITITHCVYYNNITTRIIVSIPWYGHK